MRNIQVFCALRDDPELADGQGFTYNHHVDIACWKGWLYVAWDNGRKDEDTWPAREVYSTSTDGISWTRPAELFPMGISNPLRMYFYHAANGHMLAIACARIVRGKITNATEGGVVVRELLADHTLGPVYTLIKSPAAPAGVPLFANSDDKAFADACRQLLADHTFLEQQDYGALLNDQKMKPYENASSDFGKAFCFFHRQDGTLVGIGKKGWVVQSSDNGITWSNATKLQQFTAGTAKEWIQRTIDGRFAWAHDPFPVNRYPLAVLTGDDGITFRDMRIVHGEARASDTPEPIKTLARNTSAESQNGTPIAREPIPRSGSPTASTRKTSGSAESPFQSNPLEPAGTFTHPNGRMSPSMNRKLINS